MIIQYLFILWPNKGEIIAHSVQEQDAVGFFGVAAFGHLYFNEE